MKHVLIMKQKAIVAHTKANKPAAQKVAGMKKVILFSLLALTMLFTACDEKIKESFTSAVSTETETVKKTTSNVLTDVIKSATVAMSTKENNAAGKAIFFKCIRCHGVNAERKALSKSEIIAGKSVTYLEEALAGYKAGTRNVAGMGIVMNGQIAPLSDDEIKAVAAYISTL